MSIEGTKPRKWIKNINLNNPTMHSHNVLSILNPQISRLHDSPIKYYNNKSYRQSHPKRTWENSEDLKELDSLDQSVKRFNTIEHQKTEQRTPNKKEMRQNKIDILQRGSKVWLTKSLIEPQTKCNYAYNPDMYSNYQNSKSIKNKQLHGYNIINNF